jgi:alpha-2-macroglobulin-like protein
VLVATVKNSDGTPSAERLVFRKPLHFLHVTITPSQSSYVPGDPVSLFIKTTDENGRGVSAVVGVAATDQSVLRMLEKRDRPPRLAEMVFLEGDVQDLADAQTYLDPADPQSATDTDLLLGTQGWRRFALINPAKFMQTYGDLARRAIGDLQPVARFGGGGFGGGGVAFDRLDDGIELGARAQEAASEPMGMAQSDLSSAANAAVVTRNPVPKDLPPLRLDEEGKAKFMGPMRAIPAPQVVRIYAHDLLPNRQPNDRTDFAETVYWCAGIKTDDSGTITVPFHLNDSVTTFEITADAYSASGAIGEGTATISSTKPFYVEPKLPLEVSSGDVVNVPIAAINSTPNNLSNVQMNVSAGEGVTVAPISPFDLPAGQRSRELANLQIGQIPGNFNFTVAANAGSYSDKVTRQLLVSPLGFPIQISKGGTLLADSKSVHEIEIPESLIASTLKTSGVLYPTPLASLTQALQSLLQEPNGCFEQTSSTNYPLVMADQYFNSHTGVDPAIISQSNELLDKGYARLIGFECKNKGYEWFGEDPGHECLTAYGLLEFTDMASVRSVDQTMLADTRSWLMARRDGKGGFTHERRSLHTWITDPGCSNGYCTWALLECGQTGLDAEVEWLKNDAEQDSNSYVKALAANALFLTGDKTGAKHFMDVLAAQQDTDGHVKGATTTVVGSGGDSLQIETTSLATLAWLRDPAYAANVEQAIHYLADSCKNGRYGSTQSTVLALRAIVTYDKLRAHPTQAGQVQVFVDNQPIGSPLGFDDKTTGALALPDFSDRMTPGKHAVELRMTDGSDLPYSLTVSFNSVTPSSSDQCKLGLATSLPDTTVAEGAATEAHVTVTNLSSDTLPTPIAIIGLPGGLEPRHDQLKELVKSDRIAAYEVRGRQVILYWRDIQPNEKIEIPISLTAAIPGKYTGPASRAYLYYTDEFKQWQPGMGITITPK